MKSPIKKHKLRLSFAPLRSRFSQPLLAHAPQSHFSPPRSRLSQQHSLLAQLLAVITFSVFLAAALWLTPQTTLAATTPVLTTQITSLDSGLVVEISPSNSNVINVSGSASSSSTITLNIDRNVTINWGADLSGSTANGKYLLNLTGSGAFNLIDGAEIANSSGIITATGAGLSVNLDDGALITPSSGNGVSVNVAANDVTVNVNADGAIINEGSNSAVNVTAGVSGVRVNVNGGSIVSAPAGYAINDGGTALCTNDTRITVTDGEVAAGSACAIKSTGADSVVAVLGGMVTNTATVNSNPVIYMNGGLGDNVAVGGTGKIVASDHNLGYGIQTTGNVLIRDNAQVIATSGRAINLVGMDSVAAVDGGLVTADAGIAICTATTNPGTVANAKIIVNGGVISTTSVSAAHGTSRTICVTGEYCEVIVNGGLIYTSSDHTEAIYFNGANSKVVVNGGWVIALGHFAIEAYSGGSVYINGGFVFAYGSTPLSYRTGATLKTSAVGVISEERVILDGIDGNGSIVTDGYADIYGNGIAATWDHSEWQAFPWGSAGYTEGYANHLSAVPASLIADDSEPPPGDPFDSVPANDVYWHGNGSTPGDGIYYNYNGNAGLFPLPDIYVNYPPEKRSLTVVNGTGSGAYRPDVTVGVTADAPPSGKEFDCWIDLSGSGIYFTDPYAETTAFVMPDADIFIEAVCKDVLYALTVSGGAGSGYYPAGTLVTIMAGTPPAGKEFDTWTGGGDGSFSNAGASTARYQMPAADATVTAVYRDIPLYTFMLQGGSIDGGYQGPYPAGTVIAIRAPSAFPANYAFSGWSIVSGGGSLENAFNPVTYFTMPAANAVVSMSQPFYTGSAALRDLTVVNGTDLNGHSPYSAGVFVNVEAGAAPEGKAFSGWAITAGRGIFADASAANTLFRMSDTDATVKASYEDIEYTLFVEYGCITDGAFDGTNTGRYILGESMTLMAVSPAETSYIHYTFSGWTAEGGGAFADAAAETTFFSMPNGPVVITAHWTPLYRLDVQGGSIVPSGSFTAYVAADASVTILADAIGGDYRFGGWQCNGGGYFANANDSMTDYTMPANCAAISVDFIYTGVATTHRLTVVGGTISLVSVVQGNPAMFVAGESDITIALMSAVPPGEKFVGWIVYSDEGVLNEGNPVDRGGGSYEPDGDPQPNLNQGSLANPTAPTTAFIMPDRDVTVAAAFAEFYTLEIYDGVGIVQDEYTAGERVRIIAADLSASENKAFTCWTANDGSFVNAGIMETTFIMPAANAVATANYADIEMSLYTLTTINCTSDKHGPFSEISVGAPETVSITADLQEGKVFAHWDITGIDISDTTIDGSSMSFAMPNNNVTVTAVLVDVVYALRITNGRDGTGADSGAYPAGAHVSVTASPAPLGMVFDRWESDRGGSFDNGNAAAAVFFMPANNVTITAAYKDALPEPPSTEPPSTEPSHPSQPSQPSQPSAAPPQPAPSPNLLPGDVAHILNTKEHMAFVGGVGNRLFAPDKDMTRAEAAQMFYNLLVDKNVKIIRDFPDIDEDVWYKQAVDAMASLGVVVGRPDGCFFPEEPLTRAEFVSIAVRFTKEAQGEREGERQASPFSDVTEAHWAHGSIAAAVNHGWIGGIGDGLFAPDRPISRAEAVALTNRMLRRVPDKAYLDSHPELLFYADVPSTHWAHYEIGEASNAHSYVKDGEEKWTQVSSTP